jgi:hypothetical protein
MIRNIKTRPGLSVPRRQFLGLSTVCALALAGCQGDTPSSRRLAITGIEQSKNGSRSEFTLEVTAHVTGKYYTRGKPSFREVTFVGYDADGNQLCEQRIGSIPDDERRYETQITVVCDGTPTYLTFSTDEGPCVADVQIQPLEYNATEETYAERTRTCDGNPPSNRPKAE